MVCIVFAFAIGCIIGAVVTIGIRIFINVRRKNTTL